MAGGGTVTVGSGRGADGRERAAGPGSAPLTVETIVERDAFANLAPAWDELVLATPRPSPYLLHAWLLERWPEDGVAAPVIVVVRRGEDLVAAAPLTIERRYGIRTARLLAGAIAPADVLVRADEGVDAWAALRRGLLALPFDVFEGFGVLPGSALASLAGRRLVLVPRTDYLGLSLADGWDATYRRVTGRPGPPGTKHRRRLARQGAPAFELHRRPDDVAAALAEAVRIHDLRWAVGGDGSEFTTPAGSRFHERALRRLAECDVVRLVLVRVDGRAIGFIAYFLLAGTMFCYRVGFDPGYARCSPGLLALYHALDDADEAGMERAEWGSGDEAYKRAMSDVDEAIHDAVGLARTPLGRLAMQGRIARARLRRRLKEDERARRAYGRAVALARRGLPAAILEGGAAAGEPPAAGARTA